MSEDSDDEIIRAEAAEEPPHDCLEHLVHNSHEWTETHGLDCGPYEHCYEEWYECAICGERLTQAEVDAITKDDPDRRPF